MSASERPAPATGTGLSEDVAAKPLFEIESSAIQVRRRRAASLRCEPLADGRRDPWTAGRPAARQSLDVKIYRHTAWLYGPRVFELLDVVVANLGTDFPRAWDHRRRVWTIPIQYADDVLAYAEWKQRRIVTCEEVER